ncbi:MAG: twin-arginine translocase TatA/TatE family subunit [Anaerolineae bacterium]|jgi:sec-independent protein translocase protein TatB
MNIFSNIGITELIVILLLALLVVGPERLPELSRKLAKTLRDVRQAYENITKDLGPELMSIQETTREIRDSVDSVRSIPKDVVGSVIKAADLEDTVQELKQVEQSLQQAGKSVTQAGNMVRKPLDEIVQTAQGTLKPGAAKPTTAANEAESTPAEPAPAQPAADAEVAAPEPALDAEPAAEPQADAPGDEGQEQIDG